MRQKAFSWGRLLAALLLCCLVTAGPSLPALAVTDDFQYVLDSAGVLSNETEQEIVRRNKTLFEDTGAQIAVAAVDFLDGKDIEDYTYDLFNTWGVGSQERDNGFLLVLAIAEENYYLQSGAGVEDMFDGDEHLPDADGMAAKIAAMEKQLTIFGNQRLLFHLRRQRRELAQLRSCDRMAQALVTQLEALSHLERPGRLDEENRRRLQACGAEIRDTRPLDSVMTLDVVTNYHVGQVLTLRQALLQELGKRP